MSLPSVFKNTKVWRSSQLHNNTPTFVGEWQIGEGWRKDSWERGVVIEEREIPYTRLFHVTFRDSRLYGRSVDFRTRKSRKTSKFYQASNGYEYDGAVKYDESLLDE